MGALKIKPQDSRKIETGESCWSVGFEQCEARIGAIIKDVFDVTVISTCIRLIVVILEL